MPFKVHFYVALFLLNSYTILSTFGSQARNNLVPNKNSNSEYNSNNSNNNNSATVARRNSDVMDTGIMPNHSNNDFMFSHQAIKEQQDTAFMAVASIKMTKEFGQKNSTETERGNSLHAYAYPWSAHTPLTSHPSNIHSFRIHTFIHFPTTVCHLCRIHENICNLSLNCFRFYSLEFSLGANEYEFRTANSDIIWFNNTWTINKRQREFIKVYLKVQSTTCSDFVHKVQVIFILFLVTNHRKNGTATPSHMMHIAAAGNQSENRTR